VVVLCVSVALTAGYAAFAGQDTNWDQRNYHFYVVYAWLTGRTFADVAPAQVQTWLNPLAHLLQYLFIRALPPVLAGTAMGALAGVNGLLLWVLTRRLQGGDPTWHGRACAGLVTLIGLTGSIFVSEIGTTFAEYLSSLFILGALVAVTPARPSGIGTRELGIAGFLLGAAVGLKLVNLVYLLGLAAALLAMRRALGLRVGALVAHVLGAVCGFLATGGYWAVQLWRASGNPLFPFYNAIFVSPLYDPVNFADERFRPPSLAVASITYPFAWLLGLHPTSELPLRDARFALVAAFLPVGFLASALRQRAEGPASLTTTDSRHLWLLGLFFVGSYLIWLDQFGIQRYVLPLELLSGLLLFLSLDQVLRTRRELYLVFVALGAFGVLWTRPLDWGRIPYGTDWFGVTAVRPRPSTLYVMMGDGYPTAYVVPFLSPGDRFVRLTGNTPLEPDKSLGRWARATIESHNGPIRGLSASEITADDLARLERFGLAPTGEASCEEFQSRLDRFVSCELTKTAPSTGSAPASGQRSYSDTSSNDTATTPRERRSLPPGRNGRSTATSATTDSPENAEGGSSRSIS